MNTLSTYELNIFASKTGGQFAPASGGHFNRRTHTKKGKQFLFERPTAVLIRGILLEPVLYLAFSNKTDAEIAFAQHICLCRNEDVLMPDEIIEVSKDRFDTDAAFNGYELIFEHTEEAFQVGYNRLTHEPMFGRLHIVGTPIKSF